jgi:hypothetical protein
MKEQSTGLAKFLGLISEDFEDPVEVEKILKENVSQAEGTKFGIDIFRPDSKDRRGKNTGKINLAASYSPRENEGEPINTILEELHLLSDTNNKYHLTFTQSMTPDSFLPVKNLPSRNHSNTSIHAQATLPDTSSGGLINNSMYLSSAIALLNRLNLSMVANGVFRNTLEQIFTAIYPDQVNVSLSPGDAELAQIYQITGRKDSTPGNPQKNHDSDFINSQLDQDSGNIIYNSGEIEPLRDILGKNLFRPMTFRDSRINGFQKKYRPQDELISAPSLKDMKTMALLLQQTTNSSSDQAKISEDKLKKMIEKDLNSIGGYYDDPIPLTIHGDPDKVEVIRNTFFYLAQEILQPDVIYNMTNSSDFDYLQYLMSNSYLPQDSGNLPLDILPRSFLKEKHLFNFFRQQLPSHNNKMINIYQDQLKQVSRPVEVNTMETRDFKNNQLIYRYENATPTRLFIGANSDVNSGIPGDNHLMMSKFPSDAKIIISIGSKLEVNELTPLQDRACQMTGIIFTA